jgi:hypothetical protein
MELDWTAVGAIGEMLGGMAVIVSLIYLSFQVRQNTRALRASSTESVVASLRDWMRPLILDPDTARLFRTGVEGEWQSFSPDDRARFLHMLFGYLKTFENVHYQYRQGTLEPDLWEGWYNILSAYVMSPGVKAYWKTRRNAFSPQFRVLVESITSNAGVLRVGELAADGMSADWTPAPASAGRVASRVSLLDE